MADQSPSAMWRDVIAERDALRRKCHTYKKQLRSLTLIHRIIKREWLDYSHASSEAWMKYHEAQKHPGSLGWMELTLCLQGALAKVARLERAEKERLIAGATHPTSAEPK